MNTARTAVGAASVDGLLYAVGGECAMAKNQDDTLYLRCTECYDPVLKQWFNKSDMSKARSFVAVAAVGGYLYAIGNFSEGGFTIASVVVVVVVIFLLA